MKLELGRAENIIGVLPASEGPGDRVIVLGAHYDHVGDTGLFAMDRGLGVRPGADDNASGTALLLMLAEALAESPRDHTLVFVAFDAEELGLFGSRYYAEHPARPLARTLVMLNFDMVGRLRDDRLTVMGAIRDEPFAQALQAADDQGLTLRRRWFTPAGSDDLAFRLAGVPTLFFHTGVHDEYHRRSDRPDTLNAAGAARVARLAASVVEQLDRYEGPLRDATPAPTAQPDRAFLGVTLTQAAPGEPLEVGRVVPDSPADRAGLASGDRLVALDAVPVTGVASLLAALAEADPGQTVELTLQRDGQQQTVEVTLGHRPDKR